MYLVRKHNRGCTYPLKPARMQRSLIEASAVCSLAAQNVGLCFGYLYVCGGVRVFVRGCVCQSVLSICVHVCLKRESEREKEKEREISRGREKERETERDRD